MNARQMTIGSIIVAVSALGGFVASYSEIGGPTPVFQRQYQTDLAALEARWVVERAKFERAMRQLNRKLIALAKAHAATRIELLYQTLPPLEGPERASRLREISTWEQINDRLSATSTDALIEAPFSMEGARQ